MRPATNPTATAVSGYIQRPHSVGRGLACPSATVASPRCPLCRYPRRLPRKRQRRAVPCCCRHRRDLTGVILDSCYQANPGACIPTHTPRLNVAGLAARRACQSPNDALEIWHSRPRTRASQPFDQERARDACALGRTGQASYGHRANL